MKYLAKHFSYLHNQSVKDHSITCIFWLLAILASILVLGILLIAVINLLVQYPLVAILLVVLGVHKYRKNIEGQFEDYWKYITRD